MASVDNVILPFIARIKDYLGSGFKNLEIEIRFGDFGTKFVPGVPVKAFSRFRKFLQSKYYATYSYTTDYYYDNIRYTIEYNTQGVPQRIYQIVKTKIEKMDVPNYWFRISVATEDTTDAHVPDERISPTLIRNKRRWSFIIKQGFRVDLTEVKSLGSETVHEVEIEILPPYNVDGIGAIIKQVLGKILDSPIIYDNNEKQDVMKNTNIYLGTGSSVWSVNPNVLIQPRNLKIPDLSVGGIVPHDSKGVFYTATIKADGIRKLLVIHKSRIYLLYGNEIMKLPAPAMDLSLLNGSVFECEYIPKENSPYYILIYDTLVYQGYSTRSEFHSERLAFGKELIKLVADPKLHLEVKEFVLISTVADLFTSSNIILGKDYPFVTDGVIYTPYNYHYDSSVNRIPISERSLVIYPDVVKWKPPPQLTIDFSVRNIGSRIELLSNVKRKLIPFSIDGISPSVLTVKELLTSTDNSVFEFSWNPDQQKFVMIRPRSDQYYPDWLDVAVGKLKSGMTINFAIRNVASHIELLSSTNSVPFHTSPGVLPDVLIVPELLEASDRSVFEFSWDTIQKKFIMIKPRNDKDYPNRLDVAIDNWKAIQNPIDELTIRGQKFSLSFRYHNREKRELFMSVGKTLTGTTRTLLDIGSGRGGDVSKWVKAGFTHIICVEPNEEHQIELKRRLDSVGGLNYIIIDHTITGQDYQTIIREVKNFAPNGKIDTISYMLSLSFFFDRSESLFSIIYLVNELLVRGGYFIALTIDGRYVLQYFNNPNNYIETSGTRKANMSLIDFELRPPQVYINIPNSIVTDQLEYLTNIPELQSLLSQSKVGNVPVGMKLMSEWITDREPFLQKEEIEYVKLFTAFVMQRT